MTPSRFLNPRHPLRGTCRRGSASWRVTACALILASLAAPGQSAADANPDAPAAVPFDSANAIPARLVATEEVAAYVTSMSAILSMRGRETDPFGQVQDLSKPVVKPTVVQAPNRPAPMQVTPLSDIVRLIVISTIMPGEKSFLIGTRNVKQGDVLPLTFRGRQIQLQVTEVTSRQIGFRNMESGETATRQLELLPEGMRAGTRGITAPGMVPDGADAPINLD